MQFLILIHIYIYIHQYFKIVIDFSDFLMFLLFVWVVHGRSPDWPPDSLKLWKIQWIKAWHHQWKSVSLGLTTVPCCWSFLRQWWQTLPASAPCQAAIYDLARGPVRFCRLGGVLSALSADATRAFAPWNCTSIAWTICTSSKLWNEMVLIPCFKKIEYVEL